MARIRKFAAYRRIERPYTRISKFKKKSYIKANPKANIIKFAMGNMKKKFPFNNYFLSDSVFGIDNKRTRNLVSEINNSFPDLYFFYQNRIDLMNSNMVDFLSQNNFIGLWVGLESLSDSTLQLMGKGKPILRVRLKMLRQ